MGRLVYPITWLRISEVGVMSWGFCIRSAVMPWGGACLGKWAPSTWCTPRYMCDVNFCRAFIIPFLFLVHLPAPLPWPLFHLSTSWREGLESCPSSEGDGPVTTSPPSVSLDLREPLATIQCTERVSVRALA